MGWDLDAIYEDSGQYVRSRSDPVAKRAFEAAQQEAIAMAGSVDANFSEGGLDVSDCVRAMARYAGETDKFAIWDAARVRALHQAIVWPERGEVVEENWWPIVSARLFLKVCAEQGYGIQFDP